MIDDSSVPPPVSLKQSPLAEPSTDERYGARRLLGEGGMGEVLLCRDARIGRDVALKKMRGSMPATAALDRFVREARVQGQLEHPSVVPVYDLGIAPDGEPYFTMKRVRGVTLQQVIAQLARDPHTHYTRRKLLAAFAQVCLAVSYAHARGVLHRDIKPSNVMLGDFGEVYLLDWGLARIDEACEPTQRTHDENPPALSDSGGQTADGEFLGTLGYMAPEQARGEHSRLDERADVYSLGVVLFEILTLEPLHRGTTLGELLASTIEETDPRERLRANDVPPELEEACARAVALDRSARVESARALHQSIERYLEGDRDLERRHVLAEQHAAEALVCAERALAPSGTAGDRGMAMRAAGRALVLDPNNARAATAMLRLLAQPPRELPVEARVAEQASVDESVRNVARRGALTYLVWLSGYPALVWMGVRAWTTFAVLASMLLGATLCSFLGARTRRLRTVAFAAAFALGSAAVAGSASFLGPFILGPSIAVVHTMFYAILPGRGWRAAVLASGALAVIAPWMAERTGLVAPSIAFEGGGMLILPRLTEIPPGATVGIMLAGNVLAVLIAGFFISRYRDALREAQQRVRVYAWHLDHLVPREVLRQGS